MLSWIIYYICFGWLLKRETIEIIGVEDMAVINDIQEINLSIQCKNKRGNISQVYGTPVWSTTTPDILDLIPASDGLSCLVKAKGALGDGQVKVDAYVDQAQTKLRSATKAIPVAASPGDTLSVIEGAIGIQAEFV